MSLKNIKSNIQAERGFTIVELLIVVVVIAILAAITIVSYNGITNRANASAAQSTAAALQKKAELFASDGPTGQYPIRLSDLTGTAIVLANPALNPAVTTTSANTWYVAPNSIEVTANPATNPTASNGKNTVKYQPCGTFSSGTASANMTSVAGANITWWDFTKSSSQATTITLGTVSGTCATT